MAEPGENMRKDKLPMVIWWHLNQVAFTFQSPEPLSAGADKIIRSLRLGQLDTFLKAHNFQLQPFTKKDVPRPKHRDDDGDDDDHNGDDDGKGKQETGKDTMPAAFAQPVDVQAAAATTSRLNSRTGKYFFRSASGEGTSAITFFHVEKMGNAAQDTGWTSQGAMAEGTMAQGAMAQNTMPQDAMSEEEDKNPYEYDDTLEVVKLVNNNREALQKQGIPPFSAMPNWLNGGTPFGCGTHGCPVTPPIAVTDTCSVSPGNWPFRLSVDIPPEGEADLTAFVLDTLPTSDQITKALAAANQNGVAQNLLLNAMATNMVESPLEAAPPAITINYTQLPDILDTVNPEQPATGKDIYGFLVGYPIEDHGTFVAGIVRDIDPRVKIECVRVLNNFGVGDTTTLMAVFQDIQDRFATGTLSRAVINLSLVATPSDEELGMPPYNLTQADIQPLRDALYQSIASLVAHNDVVFVASAGNDSDPRDMTMASQYRMDARYPAAFAYDSPSGPGIAQMIPVGAVNKSGNAASYSNFPGIYGVATYGGELPQPDPAQAPAVPPPPDSTPVTFVPGSIDSPRGVYTSDHYPGLYHLDPVPPLEKVLPAPEDYPEAPNRPLDTWAYWSGTSFATPIISAVAARVLQLGVPGSDVRGVVLSAANLRSNWDRLSPTDSPGGTALVPLIMAIQCEVLE